MALHSPKLSPFPGTTRWRPLALACCFLGLGAWKAESAEPSIPLRLTRQLLADTEGTDSPRSPTPALPGFITADVLEGRTDDVMEARGNVELRRSDSRILSDELSYRPLDDQVEARGNVRFLHGSSEFTGPFLQRNLTDMTGYFDRPSYRILRQIRRKQSERSTAPGVMNTQNDLPEVRLSEASGEAKRLDFLGENQLQLTKGTFSSCKPLQRDWYLQADSIHLDYDTDNGESKGSTLFFKDVPILALPTLSFPVSGNRRSGFLAPTFMSSSRDGLDLTVPYYLNLAPNYDLLVNARTIADRGTQLGGEMGYLSHNYNGALRYEFLDDQKYREGRQAYNWAHTQNIGRGITSNIQWNGVSDGDYYTDLSTRLVQTSQTLLPRQVSFSYAPSPWLTTTSRYLSYQTLRSDISKPYALEPQLNLVGRQPNLYGADLQLLSQYTQFTHPTNVQGQRLVAYPQLTLPYESPAFFVRPKFGLHATQYELNTQGLGNVSETRVLPTFTFDTGMVFERETRFWGRDTLQTLEPRLYYVHIPYHNQSRLPVFDTALADFNFAQIFSENRYLGTDRINDAEQMTAALSSRLVDPKTGAESMKAMLGQRYYFSPQKVTLNSIYPNMPTETARTDDFSSIIAAYSGLVANRTYLDSAWEYSYRDEQTMRYSLGTRYQPAFGKALTMSYRFNRDEATLTNQVDQYDLAAQWPLFGRWYGVGRYNYSLQDKRMLEGIAGLEYNAGCWMSRVVAQKIELITGQPNTLLMFQLELNDFGQIGTNPLQLLRRSIPGYGRINEANSGSLVQ